MMSFNRTNLDIFQTKLEEVLNRYVITESGIYNRDETGCTTVQKLPQVVGFKDAHQVGQVTSRERGELVTMVGIVYTNGNAVLLALIFPRVRFDEAQMMNGVPSACLGLVYPTGWMTSKNFPAALEHFVLHTRCSMDHKVLLIMDNHESHLSVEGISFAKENGIVFLTLPPHISSKLQPLDVSVFGPFKTFYNQELNAWMLQHHGHVAIIYDIEPVMSSAWDKAATPVNVKSGFRCTGISPFSTMVFSDEDFAGSYVTDRPDPSAGPPPGLEATKETSAPVTSQEDSTSQSNEVSFPDATAETNIASSPSTLAKSPEQVQPFPKAPARKETARGKKRGKCTVATDTPEKNQLEEKKHQTKKTKLLSRKIGLQFSDNKHVESSDKDLAMEKLLTEELKQSSEDSNEDSDDKVVNFVSKTPEENDFVDPPKGEKVYHVGNLLSNMDGDGDFQVSYPRKSNKTKEDNFYFRLEVDEASFSRNAVVGVLPEPISQNTK